MNPTSALLGLLEPRARHGYDLKRTIDQEYAPFWRIDYAQLYRSLARMKRRGWIRVHVEPGAGGPERKMYALTPRGRRAFAAWLQEPAEDRDEFFVKLRLANSAQVSIDHLVDEQRKAFQDEHADRLKTLHEAWSAGDAGRIVLADAALRETEASLAALDLWTPGIPSRPRATRAPRSGPLVIIGSDDPLLAYLAQLTSSSATAVGSLGGLLALSRREADVAGVHLLDLETGEYNVPFVRRLLPEDDVVLVNFAFRENGLMVSRRHPAGIRLLRDLTRRGVRFINRQPGAGTRLLLYSRLRAARIDPHSLSDWERVAFTHEAVAAAIATGGADVGPGLEAIAAEWGLDFILLGKERYDLVVAGPTFDSGRLEPLLEGLASAPFRQKAAEYHGYDFSRSGQIVARIE